MKLHSHYCQDPNCPGRWADDECTNEPREERRPKVGDEVRILVPDPIWPDVNSFKITQVGSETFTARHGSLGIFRKLADRGHTWDFSGDEPATKPEPTPSGQDCRCSEPSDGLTEREREAWEIHNAGTVAGYDFRAYDWGDMKKSRRRECLGARDKAEVIFSAKAEERVKRAEQERDEARARVARLEVQLAGCGVAADGWAKDGNDAKPGDYGYSASLEWDKVGQEALRGLQPRLGSSIAEESAKAIRAIRDENSRLTAQNAELVTALRGCAHEDGATWRLVAARRLLARIDAEAAGKKSAVPQDEPATGEEHAPVLHLPEPTYDDLLKGREFATKYITRVEAALTRVWEIVTKWRRGGADMTSAEAMREIAEAMGIRE
jgi:hypothetical protein